MSPSDKPLTRPQSVCMSMILLGVVLGVVGIAMQGAAKAAAGPHSPEWPDPTAHTVIGVAAAIGIGGLIGLAWLIRKEPAEAEAPAQNWREAWDRSISSAVGNIAAWYIMQFLLRQFNFFTFIGGPLIILAFYVGFARLLGAIRIRRQLVNS